ncbi:nucleotidyl transferase AbiEii/AbiGii toxin family protein [Streptococcus suis]|uniref:nucleotidyl transferase AbiEii/AbiGii toxin family protein n=1 Tax=Streptococcus suis TaxID=1307 RepID=UPI0004085905|nr:nucleotidyl transferase AbiEii/AbiGii toxin family protein [Streptococcus suis]HEM3195439.1 nucleotidyl transferase AbiEii/AbiGii toxin family protein [Streptococcus suis 10581]MCK3921047.1 nucleotidyl transferase AbiEii/AbiGii toxin family protein [Streptococcus suis]HEL1816696.1 nucleotidyl transferase AbiEii/AbiGii toxin family protein [Streptococcus suis]HEL2021998.1 nucleotidyl transferase AbiEii/AbiGii toxin family protein [Streptococcus suis]HEL2242020.1 nucleotidyl transferase AbiEi
MLEFKKISKDDLQAIIRNAAERLGINEVIVEKDYWVCFVLNYLFTKSEWKDAFTFKGGTSLSKCYDLIKRFSEDIDLILDWQVIGYGKDEPWQSRSNTQQDKFNKESNLKAEDFLVNTLIPQMRLDFAKLIEDDFQISIDVNDQQTVLFEYPTSFQSEYVKQVIRLEIGALAAWTPSEMVEITPDLYKVYPMLFVGDSISVRTVLPERTFWEKATILHHEANRPADSKIPIRYARHYYDIYCLAHSIYKNRAFMNQELLEKVVSFKEKFYPRKWAKYEDATIERIRLLPDDYRLNEIESDYNQMKEMFYGSVPSFEELLTTIANLEKEIHKL